MIQEKIKGRKGDLEAQIKRIQERAAADIAAIERQKAALEAAEKFVTPQMEEMLKRLQEIGLLTDLT